MQDRLRAAPALVGRDGELGELLAGMDDVASRSGRLFLLGGGVQTVRADIRLLAADCGVPQRKM